MICGFLPRTLESGDKEGNEDTRVKQVGTFTSFMNHHLKDFPGCPVIVGMDGNSYRAYSNGKYSPDKNNNMYSLLCEMTKERDLRYKTMSTEQKRTKRTSSLYPSTKFEAF